MGQAVGDFGIDRLGAEDDVAVTHFAAPRRLCEAAEAIVCDVDAVLVGDNSLVVEIVSGCDAEA